MIDITQVDLSALSMPSEATLSDTRGKYVKYLIYFLITASVVASILIINNIKKQEKVWTIRTISTK